MDSFVLSNRAAVHSHVRRRTETPLHTKLTKYYFNQKWVLNDEQTSLVKAVCCRHPPEKTEFCLTFARGHFKNKSKSCGDFETTILLDEKIHADFIDVTMTLCFIITSTTKICITRMITRMKKSKKCSNRIMSHLSKSTQCLT